MTDLRSAGLTVEALAVTPSNLDLGSLSLEVLAITPSNLDLGGLLVEILHVPAPPAPPVRTIDGDRVVIMLDGEWVGFE